MEKNEEIAAHDLELVVITGMSGAGKTVAMQSFEDLGFFCVDNLPPALIPKFIDLVENSGGKMRRVALVIDLRGREFFDQLFAAIDLVGQDAKLTPQIIFLDASDSSLVRRYKETRRSHPLAGGGGLLEGIQAERKLLDDLRGQAQMIIDTSNLKPVHLRERIIEQFSQSEKQAFSVQIVTFGFKYGMPMDADLVFDVRFLPNPHYVDGLRPKTGLDSEVSDYVLKWSETQQFIQKLSDLLLYMLPHYKREGKRQLVLAIGCTGGKHRSVTLGEYYKKLFTEEGFHTYVTHRDVEKGKKE